MTRLLMRTQSSEDLLSFYPMTSDMNLTSHASDGPLGVGVRVRLHHGTTKFVVVRGLPPGPRGGVPSKDIRNFKRLAQLLTAIGPPHFRLLADFDLPFVV